jgi:frizzled protein 9/10
MWCIAVFLVSYFFTISSAVWWVVLAVSFYLSAGRKWSREAIETRAATYFHVVAWTLPAAATVTALALRKVDADELTGLCAVGNGDRGALLSFVVVPLFACLVVGSAFVVAGFAAMFRIRGDLMRRGGGDSVGVGAGDACVDGVGPGDVRSLEKLMVKIGVFSVLYTVPATCIVACFLYQQLNMDEWRRQAAETDCKTSAAESMEDCSLDDPIAPVEVQLLRVFMLLVGGATSAMWICSRKTTETWHRWFAGRVRGGGRGGAGGGGGTLGVRVGRCVAKADDADCSVSIGCRRNAGAHDVVRIAGRRCGGGHIPEVRSGAASSTVVRTEDAHMTLTTATGGSSKSCKPRIEPSSCCIFRRIQANR